MSMPNVVLWVRKGDRASEDAQAFLKANGYGADEVRDVDAAPPTAEERRRLAVGLGGDEAPLTDPRRPDGLRAPLLLTPRGALAGFRESRWRAFLDIGRGRP